MVSNTRLYGAAIAYASGLYSLWSASEGLMQTSGLLMAVLGVIVLVHGTILLTAYADQIGRASGPLMIVYAAVMLLNQAVLGAGILDDAGGMGMSDGMGGSGLTAGMGWDAGMVTLALLMLFSGLIMTRGASTDATTPMM